MIRPAAVLLLAGVCFAAPVQDSMTKFKGKTPPELKGAKGDWFNAPEGLTLESLKGKVVWLEFSFLN